MYYIVNPQLFTYAIIKELMIPYEVIFTKTTHPFSTCDLNEKIAFLRNTFYTQQQNHFCLAILSEHKTVQNKTLIRVCIGIWNGDFFQSNEIVFYMYDFEKNIPVRKPFYDDISYNIIEESSSIIVIEGVKDLFDVLMCTKHRVKKMLEQVKVSV